MLAQPVRIASASMAVRSSLVVEVGSQLAVNMGLSAVHPRGSMAMSGAQR